MRKANNVEAVMMHVHILMGKPQLVSMRLRVECSMVVVKWHGVKWHGVKWHGVKWHGDLLLRG